MNCRVVLDGSGRPPACRGLPGAVAEWPCHRYTTAPPASPDPITITNPRGVHQNGEQQSQPFHPDAPPRAASLTVTGFLGRWWIASNSHLSLDIIPGHGKAIGSPSSRCRIYPRSPRARVRTVAL